jgi:hypothetical protein
MIPITRVMHDRNLFGGALEPPDTWSAWRTILQAAFGEPIDDQELFTAVSGGRPPPARPVSEFWGVAGRRGGKSRMAGLIAAYTATCLDHAAKLAPGETGYVLCLAPSRDQASVVRDYAYGFIAGSPVLRKQLRHTTQDEIRLHGNVVIAVHPPNFRTIRGRTLLACVFDESAFWRDETSATPDIEAYRAVVPALASTGGMLIGIGSPYRRVGLLHNKFAAHYGKDDPSVLVVKAPTTVLNPCIDPEVIDRARQDDPTAALSEWDAEFRSDIRQFLDDELIDSAVDHGRPPELPPRRQTYHAFVDASAGRHDAFTIAIVHRQDDRCIADVIRGRKPPFDPRQVAEEFAALAREYGCRKVVGDNYAGQWVADAFGDCGITYEKSALTKSQLYLEGLPQFARGTVSIPDHPVLIRELRLLERRVHRSGKDSVDHGTHGSDDHANALFGALHLLREQQPAVTAIGYGAGFGRIHWVDPHAERTRIRVRKISESDAPPVWPVRG